MTAWRLIDDGPGEAAMNMARDHALLLAVAEGRVPPTVRLYRWLSPAVSLGYFQDPETSVDVERARERGVSVVRRPTGGRALYHGIAFTYSVAAPLDHPQFAGGLRATHDAVARALVAAVTRLGVAGAAAATRSRGALRSPACFATLNHGEISVGGRKLLASAQRRVRGGFLQHGSLPLELPGELASDLFLYESAAAYARARELLTRHTTALSEWVPAPVSCEALTAAFRHGFESALGAEFESAGWTAWEKKAAEGLLVDADISAGQGGRKAGAPRPICR